VQIIYLDAPRELILVPGDLFDRNQFIARRHALKSPANSVIPSSTARENMSLGERVSADIFIA
jgi:hypothetical protein